MLGQSCYALDFNLDAAPIKYCNSKLILAQGATVKDVSELCRDAINRYEKEVAGTKEGREYMLQAQLFQIRYEQAKKIFHYDIYDLEHFLRPRTRIMFQHNIEVKELYKIYDEVKKQERAWRMKTSGKIVKRDILYSCSDQDIDNHFAFLVKEQFQDLKKALPVGSLLRFKQKNLNKEKEPSLNKLLRK